MNRVFLIAKRGNIGRDFISEHRYHVPTLVSVVRTYVHTRTSTRRANNYIHSRRDDINTKETLHGVSSKQRRNVTKKIKKEQANSVIRS